MSSIDGSKVFETRWNCNALYGKFTGRFLLPLLDSTLLGNLLCVKEDVYDFYNFFPQIANRFPEPYRDKMVAVKYGYAPATKANLFTLLKQSIELAALFDLPLSVDALKQEIRTAILGKNVYVRYINVYKTSGRCEATLVHPKQLAREAREEAETLRRNKSITVHLCDDTVPIKAPVVKPDPVVAAVVPPKVVEAKPEPKAEPAIAAEPEDEEYAHINTNLPSVCGFPEAGMSETFCFCGVPEYEYQDPYDTFDTELHSILRHMPKAGLFSRTYLLGDGKDYIQLPVVSTVDRDWLKH
jgi:hypothetical protein